MKKVAICLAASAMMAVMGAASLTSMTTVAQAQDYSGGDAKKGAKVFNKCKACHRIGPKAKDMVGPVLNGIVGREAATWESYASKYSDFIKNKAKEVGTWEPAEIITYARDPSAFIGGTSKMTKQKLTDEQAADLIAYLETFDLEGNEKK